MMSFVTHKCKMMISPDCFSIFSKCLIFLVVGRVKGQKMAQNDKKTMSFMLHIAGTIHHMIVNLWYTFVK